MTWRIPAQCLSPDSLGPRVMWHFPLSICPWLPVMIWRVAVHCPQLPAPIWCLSAPCLCPAPYSNVTWPLCLLPVIVSLNLGIIWLVPCSPSLAAIFLLAPCDVWCRPSSLRWCDVSCGACGDLDGCRLLPAGLRWCAAGDVVVVVVQTAWCASLLHHSAEGISHCSSPAHSSLQVVNLIGPFFSSYLQADHEGVMHVLTALVHRSLALVHS